jgi:hypothetical protein
MFLESVKKPLTYLQRKVLKRKIYEKCRKMAVCASCGAYNGRRGFVLISVVWMAM